MRDLSTGQQLRHVTISHVGPLGVVGTIAFKKGADELSRKIVGNNILVVEQCRAGELYAQHVDTFELMALTGPIDVDIILGTSNA